MEYKFSGKVSLQDYIAFNNFVVKKSLFKGRKLVLFLIALALLVIAILLSAYLGEFSEMMRNMLVFVLFIALCIIIFFICLNRTYRKYYNSNKFYLEEQYYTVNEVDIKISSESAGITLTKEKIHKIMYNKNVIYIFSALNMAYIIKDTFLKDVNEFDSLKEFINEHYEER
jgi:hypothetical protein